MKYISTRSRSGTSAAGQTGSDRDGSASSLDFSDVLLAGLARDGGLYVPHSWPAFSRAELEAMVGLSYAELAVKVLLPFVGDCLSEDELSDLAKRTYAKFDEGVAPLKELSPGLHLLELFHGPTLAFKDYAMQFLGELFDHVLTKRGERITIVGATSGDTGAAAVDALADRRAIDVFMLHPKGRVSEVQRRQMTTQTAANVHNIAIEGTFDDCQDLVKAMFNDAAFRDRHNLSAVNSINWARVAAQVVYYFWAGLQLGAPARPVSFSVPTGNFGNVFAGYCAMKMGLPTEQLIIGSNANDILPRFFETGTMQMDGVVPTISPSMDIQVSSNFERLLFEMEGRDGEKVAATMKHFRETGAFSVSPDQWDGTRAVFDGFRQSDAETMATIDRIAKQTGEVLDPHSAIGVEAGLARRKGTETPVICLATAHPAKFPDAVEEACGSRPQLPPRMSDLYDRPERFDVLPNSLEVVMSHIDAHPKGAAAA
ncbi:MAG: threonine synthase [Magnetovibrionaceae bacterium]